MRVKHTAPQLALSTVSQMQIQSGFGFGLGLSTIATTHTSDASPLRTRTGTPAVSADTAAAEALSCVKSSHTFKIRNNILVQGSSVITELPCVKVYLLFCVLF